MENIYLYVMMVLILLILKKSVDILRSNRKQRKKRLNRDILANAEILILDMEIRCMDGSLDDFPLIKQKYRNFIELYDNYLIKDQLSKMRVLSYLFSDFKITEQENNALQIELENVEDESIKKLFIQQLVLANRTLFLGEPFKYNVCMFITKVKLLSREYKKIRQTLYEHKKNDIGRNMQRNGANYTTNVGMTEVSMTEVGMTEVDMTEVDMTEVGVLVKDTLVRHMAA